MRLQQIMSTPAFSISPKSELGAARDQMRAHHVRHLVVVKDDHVVGVISERDVSRAHSALFDDKWLVEDVMSEPAITATPNMTPAQAARLVQGRTIGCLPIVENDTLLGIVTTTDLLAVLARDAG
ncbi:MAG: CBS domain-containing protein [Proteobacteria bacterium]|nr:CBS domain-containing protein [Pseudomonadota bacterium]